MRALVTTLLLFAFAVPVEAQEVRVRLLERTAPRTVTVSAVGGPLEMRVGPALLGTLSSDQTAAVTAGRSGVTVRFRQTEETVESVRFVPLGSVLRLRTGRIDRRYHGALTADAERGGLRLVNTVGLEDYVASVVASEYPFEEIEGVKAQAVLARTYALKSQGKYGAYDLVDHVGSQVYRGVGSETAVTRRAAEATTGEVLTYGGALIEAVYSSSSGGHTADNESVWSGAPLPYLRGREDPYDRASPNHRWTTSVDRDELLRVLSDRYGGRVTGLTVARTSREGRVISLHLFGIERAVPANGVRLALNDAFGSRLLRSTFFTLQRRGDRYTFEGRGYGHGVGLSQYGARAQAQQGAAYRDILAFYFDGTHLAAHTDLDAPPPALAERPAVEPIPTRPVSVERPATSRPIRVGW